MATANRPYGKINKGTTIPYGTLAGASKELRETYYYYGYKEDSMLPELPCPPEEELFIDPDYEVYKKELAEQIKDMLDSLTPREAKVLRMRFGIELDCDYTLEEVGVAFYVTRERIRQIEAKAIRKMKRPERYEILRHVWRPEDFYETTAEKKRMLEQRRRTWAAQKIAEDEEKVRRFKLYEKKISMPPEKKKLWYELKPALVDAPWVANLKVEKPDMYQELKELVVAIWEEHAPDIWKNYTKENI